MKILFIAFPILILMIWPASGANAQVYRHNLMPTPAEVSFQPGKLAIRESFSVAVRGHDDRRLEAGIDRAVRRLEARIGMELRRGVVTDATNPTLVIECREAGLPVPSLNEDESYSLEVSSERATLKAPTVIGALRGLETLLQLAESDRDGYYLPCVKIDDKPRFRWRGLLFDSSRHFQPLEVIKRNLDGMASVKLNVFHWHLTDDQGFRIESKKYPKLTGMGSDGLFYTQDQAREIIAYAAERGIRVVPEFDLPGHATSWVVGYPELASASGPYQIERQPGVFDPTLDPTREEIYQFLDGFFGEMAALFPDEYMHIGGDENEGKQWDRNPQIQSFMKERGIKNNHSLQAYFTMRLARILQKYKKKTMGWEEILADDLPKDVVIHSWRGPESLAEAVKKGFSGVLSAGYYIDLSYPASNHYRVDPVAMDKNLSRQEEERILGGEATMWSEYVSPETIDSRIWPRAAAIAERFWSPRSVADVDDMYRRLAVTSVRLEELGLTHEKNYRSLLRRMAGGKEIGPLETLVSVVEPVKQYNRGQQRPTTMLSPLTGFVDAARPDSEAARNFASLVNGFLADAPRFQTNREEVERTLAKWRDARPAIEAMTRRSGLREAELLAAELSDLAQAGLEALACIVESKDTDGQWREGKLAILAQATKPKPSAVEFAILPSVRQLVIAAIELPQLRGQPPLEWQKRVKTLAEVARTQ
ncbi:MAG TPA: family 20 glycosylhydrolase [Blastocatellia bacterium]|nr:family 20 glycosylhydrolase [Blastocatellia bacterium]